MNQMGKSKIHVWTDTDMDGAGSYLALTWLLGVKPQYTVSPSNQFREAWTEWSKLNDVSTFDRIFILDLDVSDHMDLVDKPNVVIVDHHESHFPKKSEYKHATVIVEECTSTCKLLYKKFKDKITAPLTEQQKYLILLVDDYDSFLFNLPETRCCNTLFWNYQGDRVEKFCERWRNGFSYLTVDEQSICTFYVKRFERIISELQVFQAEIPVKGKKYKFLAAFATEFLNDIAQHILEKYKADVACIVNTKTSKISFRRTKACDCDVSLLAKTLADGGGHTFSAGGVLTDRFATFSKLFSPV